MKWEVHHSDVLEYLRTQPDNSFDGWLTDPPSGISFMNLSWDSNKGGMRQWVKWMTRVSEEALRVLKPGAYGVVWSLPRTSHWTGMALELAGFEIRDTITHLFAQGMPKSTNYPLALDKRLGAMGHRGKAFTVAGDTEAHGGQALDGEAAAFGEHNGITPEAQAWNGYGTGLKPGHEIWWLVRKPIEGTNAENALEWATGALNIAGSRVGSDSTTINRYQGMKPFGGGAGLPYQSEPSKGRWPSNVVLDEYAAGLVDEQSGNRKSGGGMVRRQGSTPDAFGFFNPWQGRFPSDEGGASRFFFVAKPSQAERDAGLDGENTHPTVKSIPLATRLATVILPPPHNPRRLLNTFSGTGTEGIGGINAGWNEVVMVEGELKSVEDSRQRVSYWCEGELWKQPAPVEDPELPKAEQGGLF